MDKWTRCKPD